MNEQTIQFIRTEAKRAYSILKPFSQAQTTEKEIFRLMKQRWKAGDNLTREQREKA